MSVSVSESVLPLMGCFLPTQASTVQVERSQSLVQAQNSYYQGSYTSTDKKNSTTFPGPSKFPRTFSGLPTFKYNDKQQLLTVHTECKNADIFWNLFHHCI